MSLSRETMLELMALADGELQGEAKERAENLAARDEEARRVVEAMRATAVRTWLNDIVSQQTQAADGIADDVIARLEAEPPPMSTATARRVRRIAKQQVVAISVVAVAAALAIYVRSDHRHAAPAPVASVRIPSEVTLANSVEVDEVDSIANVSIFQIQPTSPNKRSSVVVWIEDETAEQ